MPPDPVPAAIDATPEQVWAVLANPSTWGAWVEIHQGFAGEAPAQFVPGGAFVQRVRVLNMPADVRWTVVGLQEPVRLELEGTGPMGSTCVPSTASRSRAPVRP